MRSHKAQFDGRGVAIVVVSFAPPSKLVDYQQRQQWPFVLLSDPDREAYRLFNLPRLSWGRVFSPATLRLYIRLWREGKRRQDYGKEDIYQAGGDFIIDRNGEMLFAYRSRQPSDRPSAAELLGAIDRIRAR